MPTISLYLDERHIKKSGCAPLKISIRNRSTVAYISTDYDIPPKCWLHNRVVSSKDKATDALMPYPPKVMNFKITERLTEVQMLAHELCGWKSNMDAPTIKDKIIMALEGKEVTVKGSRSRGQDGVLLVDCWEEKISLLEVKKTKEVYQATLRYVQKVMSRVDGLLMEDIDENWMHLWMDKMKKGCKAHKPLHPNSISNYLNMFKAVWHYGQRQGYVSREHIPYEGMKAPRVATRSRALTIEDMRKVWNTDILSADVHYNAVRNVMIGRDMFCLSFCLCGINTTDLYDLRESDIRAGRLEVDRKKTGVHINVKIEPEAQEIIDRYKKDGYLIGKIRKDSVEYVTMSVNRGLKNIMDGLTMYWARHTWASLAVELDIPDRTVFMGLAHRQGKPSDETYITMRNRKLDKANRKIIDYVLGKVEAPD